MGRGASGRDTTGNYQRATLATQAEHADVVRRLEDQSYPSGTYDTQTLRPVEYDSGYQVTFCQIGDDYSRGEYAGRVNEFLRYSSDGRTLAGKFEGTPEISFHVANRATAIRLAKKYNQISVWDWQNCDEINTGGTGRRRR